uniref:Uncharacterized protein n=1 Tax=Pristionchus pacificus TaxID=54126 RepID=A0A2A6B8X9_PRIPA|eukprot:PDM62340.1 hypothetical protein PRIPAC_51782 [Pristionchus pacificus]
MDEPTEEESYPRKDPFYLYPLQRRVTDREDGILKFQYQESELMLRAYGNYTEPSVGEKTKRIDCECMH